MKALVVGAALVIWVSLGFARRIYERLETADPLTTLNDSFQQVAAGELLLLGFLYLVKLDISRSSSALFGIFNLLALIAYRVSARSLRGYLRRQFGAESYFVVVGLGPAAQQVGRALEEAHQYGAKLIAFVDPDGGSPDRSIELSASYPVQAVSDLRDMLRNHVIDEILFAVDRDQRAGLESIFLP